MRLDLFLKTSRLVKRRTVAQELCDSASVLLNGMAAKPAREVRRGDRITLRFSARTIDVEVLDVPLSSKRPADVPLFRVISDLRTATDQDL